MKVLDGNVARPGTQINDEEANMRRSFLIGAALLILRLHRPLFANGETAAVRNAARRMQRSQMGRGRP